MFVRFFRCTLFFNWFPSAGQFDCHPIQHPCQPILFSVVVVGFFSNALTNRSFVILISICVLNPFYVSYVPMLSSRLKRHMQIGSIHLNKQIMCNQAAPSYFFSLSLSPALFYYFATFLSLSLVHILGRSRTKQRNQISYWKSLNHIISSHWAHNENETKKNMYRGRVKKGLQPHHNWSLLSYF